MLIHEKLPQGSLYPQLTQAPTNYTEFLNFFRGGQTLDDNTLLTTADTLQTNMFKVAIANGHLKRDGNPIQGVEISTKHKHSMVRRVYTSFTVPLEEKE